MGADLKLDALNWVVALGEVERCGGNPVPHLRLKKWGQSHVENNESDAHMDRQRIFRFPPCGKDFHVVHNNHEPHKKGELDQSDPKSTNNQSTRESTLLTSESGERQKMNREESTFLDQKHVQYLVLSLNHRNVQHWKGCKRERVKTDEVKRSSISMQVMIWTTACVITTWFTMKKCSLDTDQLARGTYT